MKFIDLQKFVSIRYTPPLPSFLENSVKLSFNYRNLVKSISRKLAQLGQEIRYKTSPDHYTND